MKHASMVSFRSADFSFFTLLNNEHLMMINTLYTYSTNEKKFLLVNTFVYYQHIQLLSFDLAADVTHRMYMPHFFAYLQTRYIITCIGNKYQQDFQRSGLKKLVLSYSECNIQILLWVKYRRSTVWPEKSLHHQKSYWELLNVTPLMPESVFMFVSSQTDIYSFL